MSLCKLHLDNRTLIIIITALIMSINFRSAYHYVNYHMDIGNFYSLSYDPLLLLIKNFISTFFLLAYFIELRIIKSINMDIENKKLIIENIEGKCNVNDECEEDENENEKEKIGVIDSMVLYKNFDEKNDKYLVIIKSTILIIIIYVCEDITFITINNHILDRLICPIRNAFALFAILILSGIIYHKKIIKTHIKNFIVLRKHQVIPLIIIFILSIIILIFNSRGVIRFKVVYEFTNLFYFIIICILLGLELTCIKYLLEHLNINKFLILGLKGLLGTVVFSIIYIMKFNDNTDYIYEFCSDIFQYQFYFEREEFSIWFKIIYTLSLVITQYLKIIVINKFSEMHFLSAMMIADIFSFLLYCFERFYIESFNISTKNTFFLNIFIYIINTLLMLVLNEILELNFCGLNLYLRKNIIIREEKEFYGLIKDLSTVKNDTISDNDISSDGNIVNNNFD